MKKNDIYKLLSVKIDQDEIMIDEPMKKHTSFKIGGPADFFITPKNRLHLIEAIKVCNENRLPFYIIGNGSNLLVKDKGIRGIVIQICKHMSRISIEEENVYAEAGVLLSKLAHNIYEAGLEGFEFASGIPGTLGGAVYMNAGAYGREMKDVIESVEVVDSRGRFVTIQKADLSFGYRKSVLQTNGYIAVGATLKLMKGEKTKIKAIIDDLTHRRITKQPLEMPSAGSTFKRPEGYYAGKLIMDSGLRGYSIGDAQVSDKHCGFVVNKGNATSEDVLNLIRHIGSVVKEKYGVDLEPEVKVLGE